MFKFTNIVMHYAPIGVGAAIAYTVGHGGLRVLVNLAWLGYYALPGADGLCAARAPAGGAALLLVPIRKFVKAVKEPAIIAFSTTSSSGAAAAMEVVERSACRARSWRSYCRSATASTLMERRSICRWRRCSSRKPLESS